MANVNARTGHFHDASTHLPENCKKRTQLNTHIYEYFFHHGMFDCAQAILKADSDVKVQRHDPCNPCDDEHCRLNNAFYNESVSIGFGFKHPEQLPIPSVLNLSPESCFLYEWFSLLWAMFSAQKNVHGRGEGNQCAGLMQQQNRPRWNASRSRTQSSLLPPHGPARTTYNAFYNSGEMDVGNRKPRTSGAQACGRRNRALQEFQVQLTSMEQQNQDVLTARQGRSGLSRNDGVPGGWGGQGPPEGPQPFQRSALQGARPGALSNTANQMKLGTQQMNNIGMGGVSGNMAMVRMNGWTRASTSSHLCRQSNGQAMRQPVVAKEMQFQLQEETGHNGPVQWQNDPSENQIPQTAQHGVQGTLQERSRSPSFKLGHANDSAKPRSTISSPPQTSKATPPTPQLGRAAREKRPVPKGTTPRKGTKKVKTEMVTWNIPKFNVSSGATPTRTTPNLVPHINPVDVNKDTQDTGLAQVVPTGQPAVPLALTPASLVANAPLHLVESVTFSMENPNMTDYVSIPTFEGALHGFDLDSFLESTSKNLGVFPFNYFPF
ncbi:hypothetical protein RAB80_014620 [Fusarium oxysporum f. sp. vasinfectum]|uniref:Uncharacterized protein n=1 Tax=Fusarium oxysporum f. sp. vasinfectum 25433 TaxID=1089449 RepID=X0KUG4_FUSOX|nr:hypothetical protein FOTG_19072 [Fusarium oxysporum f. sp. vasinfectum 25433]KAK2669094.1 hypothetical protein RAB80_014620 [Fusarium oxysporum f. sp. vasinfectum]KAK2926518.1 hypothetical protein FoTM2_013386 [Fusarium oxysporum f. sp. vasinfectum]